VSQKAPTPQPASPRAGRLVALGRHSMGSLGSVTGLRNMAGSVVGASMLGAGGRTTTSQKQLVRTTDKQRLGKEHQELRYR
jgi:hypothetical protein